MHFFFKLTRLKPSRFYPIHLKGEAITSLHFEDGFKRTERTGELHIGTQHPSRLLANTLTDKERSAEREPDQEKASEKT